MSAIAPVLIQGTGIGAVFGIGMELLNSGAQGKWFATALITSVAVRAIGYYLGSVTGIGIFIGAVLGIIHKIDDMNRDPCGYANTVIGAALIGGTLGYLGSFVRPLSDLSAMVI